MELVGKTLGPYHIEGFIGGGGQAEVYRARRKDLGGEVALKVITRDLRGHKESIARFRRESRILAHLDHPGIVRIYDCDYVDGVAFFAMQLIGFPTLAQLLRDAGPQDGRLPTWRALKIARSLLDALAAVHGAEVIHRDIKPSNIFVTPDDDAILGDFGIARSAGETFGLTATGEVIGTVAYMPPEQVAGQRVDFRSDIYSAGLVLYEMLTGCLPFPREIVQVVRFKTSGEAIPAPSRFRPEVGLELDLAVLRACAAAPEQRFASAIEFSRALQALPAPVSRPQTPLAGPGAHSGGTAAPPGGGAAAPAQSADPGEPGLAAAGREQHPAPQGVRRYQGVAGGILAGFLVGWLVWAYSRTLTGRSSDAALQGPQASGVATPTPSGPSPVPESASRGPSAQAPAVRSPPEAAQRLASALSALAPLSLERRIVGDFRNVAYASATEDERRQRRDALRERWGTELAARIREARLAQTAHDFAAVKDEAYCSHDLDKVEKSQLYASVQDLAELEDAGRDFEVPIPALSHEIQSEEYGLTTGSRLKFYTGCGLRLDAGTGHGVPEGSPSDPIRWESSAARDVPLKAFYDIRDGMATDTLVAAADVPLYVHPRPVWFPPRSTPRHAEIWCSGLTDRALRLLVSPQAEADRAHWRLLAVLRGTAGLPLRVFHTIPPDVLPDRPAFLRLEIAYSGARAVAHGDVWQEAYVSWIMIVHDAGNTR